MNNRKVLILSPHCDDVGLSLGASLLAGAWGNSVHAVVIFSRSAYTRFAGWKNSVDEASALRQAEERRAAELAGYTVEFLPYGEPYARPGYQDIGEVFDTGRRIEGETIWEDVRGALSALIAGWEGVVLAPLGLGEHIDHRIVRACFLEAAQRNERIIPAFYEDLPYAAQYSSLQIRDRVPMSVRGQALVPRALHGNDIGPKLELLAVYDSQMTDGMLDNTIAHWECRGLGELVWLPRGAIE